MRARFWRLLIWFYQLSLGKVKLHEPTLVLEFELRFRLGLEVGLGKSVGQEHWTEMVKGSPVWDFFGEDPEDKDRRICQVKVGDKICGTKRFAKGGTSTTCARHLDLSHPAEYAIVKENQKSKQPTKRAAKEGDVDEPKKKEPRLHFFGETELQLDKRISDAIVDFLADTGVAFSITGRESFIRLMKTANKKIKLKHPSTYSKMIKLRAEEVLDDIAGITSTLKAHGEINRYLDVKGHGSIHVPYNSLCGQKLGPPPMDPVCKTLPKQPHREEHQSRAHKHDPG